MKTLETEILEALDTGLLIDRSKKPLRPVVTVVGSAREQHDASGFIQELKQRYPLARLVLSDKSPVERSAAETAEKLGMPVEYVAAGVKGEWDQGATIQDERIVAKASHVVAFDQSARSNSYRVLAQRQLKHFSQINTQEATSHHESSRERVYDV